MANRRLQAQLSGFPLGLNTEASVLNVLPIEFMDGTENIELLDNGSVRRRRGVDFIGQSTSGTYLHTVRTSTEAVETSLEVPSSFFAVLSAPNGNIIERVVTDINNEFWVFDADQFGLKNFDAPKQTITRSVSHDDQKFHNMDFASDGNKLYFAGEHTQPGYLEVDTDNISLKLTYYDVIIRTIDSTELNIRVKNTIDSTSRWFECIEAHTSVAADNEPGVGTNWNRYWAEKYRAQPAGLSAWADTTAYTTQMTKPYSKDVVPGIADTYPTSVEFYAGRVWLAGDPTYPNRKYFSQAISRDEHISRFFQDADPYDTSDPDLVDSDGGALVTRGAGLVYSLIAISGSLFHGNTNGIWQISGPDSIFKATNFFNHKVLNEGIEGHGVMVRIEQEICVFGQSAIWLSDIEESIAVTTSGRAQFVNLSHERVKTLYENIPRKNKAAAKALYNPSSKTLHYFHNRVANTLNSARNSKNQPNNFLAELVLDASFLNEAITELEDPDNLRRRVKAAYYLNTFPDLHHDNGPYIAFPFIAPEINAATNQVIADGFPTDDVFENVYDASDNLIVASGGETGKDNILFVAMVFERSGGTVTIKGSFCKINGTVPIDFNSDTTNKTSFSSTLKFGVQALGDVLHKKGGTYVYLVFKRVESFVLDDDDIDTTPGGCYMRVATQFATGTVAAKYGPQIQVYYPYRYYTTLDDGSDPNISSTWYKRRIRGRGNVVQFILENEGDKDFHLIGYNHQFWGNQD